MRKYGSEKARTTAYFMHVLLNIFSHSLNLRKDISFVSAREIFVRQNNINCLTVRKLKVRKFDGIQAYVFIYIYIYIHVCI